MYHSLYALNVLEESIIQKVHESLFQEINAPLHGNLLLYIIELLISASASLLSLPRREKGNNNNYPDEIEMRDVHHSPPYFILYKIKNKIFLIIMRARAQMREKE